jgi:CBS domain-containing protein
VVSPDRVIGMVTATDLLQRHSTSAVHLVGDVYKRNTVEEMAEISATVPELLVNLVSSGATAQSAGHIITAVGEAITCRLLQLGEEQFGPPPIPYAWIVCGSQARNEQTAHSDQDNGIILDDSYDEASHGEYFVQLANFVCDGLNACGYVYCPGDIMAKTDKWRQPLAKWKGYFRNWIDEPEPKALMHASIFFDMRCLYGQSELFEELHAYQLQKSSGNRIFLAFMAGNALQHTPPLGFFRNFVLEKGGEHDHTLNLKHNGVVPIIDLARVYALAGGSPAVNTYDRLRAALHSREISHGSAEDLLDAFEFISHVRLENQARQVRAGGTANNFVSPQELSHFERNHLKDAFSVVRTLQQTLAQRYTK